MSNPPPPPRLKIVNPHIRSGRRTDNAFTPKPNYIWPAESAAFVNNQTNRLCTIAIF